MAGFDSIFAEVTARLGNRAGLGARVTGWINDAYFELMLHPRATFHEIEKSAQLTTEVDVTAYAVPADLWFILNLRDETNGREIRKGSWRSFDRKPNSSGLPNRYDHFGTTIELDPTPDSAINIVLRYRVRPAELVAGGTHLLGREWDEAITVLAVIKGFEGLEQTEQAAGQRTLLEALMSTRLDVRELEDTEQELSIQPRLL